MHPDDWLTDRAQGVGQVSLGHHDALEQVRRLADDDGVDVGEIQPGVLKRAQRGLTDQARDGHVPALGAIPRLAHTDDRATITHPAPPH